MKMQHRAVKLTAYLSQVLSIADPTVTRQPAFQVVSHFKNFKLSEFDTQEMVMVVVKTLNLFQTATSPRNTSVLVNSRKFKDVSTLHKSPNFF